MSDNTSHSSDDLRPKYGEAELEALLQDGVRGKYVERYRQGTNLVKLAPDVAAAFPTDPLVNEALAAARGLRQAQPAAEVWLVRVGHRTLHRWGRQPKEKPKLGYNEGVHTRRLRKEQSDSLGSRQREDL